MNLQSKLEILAAAAKYDVSCSSSGSSRKNSPGGIGNAAQCGICHSWSQDGRCISLLKILLTNDCIFNCTYCVNRSSNDVPRASFTPDEVADITINFYRRNFIEGLFLSSAVIKSPDYTMELMIKTVHKLRSEYRFNGYIHMKAIPGADAALISKAGRLADRMSVNIELPSSEGLKLLAPQKNKESIVKPMSFINSRILERQEERRIYKKAPSFVPAGQSTQLIVGATRDSDLKILRLSENLYNRFNLKRVYYSAYVPVLEHPSLPALNAGPPLLREHRLYQADWLLRFYGFSANELLNEGQPDFSIDLDPKSDWAIRNLHMFPVEINIADINTLLRVPGIGVKSARRIAAARRICSLDFDSLKRLGVVLKRARFFITCKGKYYGEKRINELVIKNGLLADKPPRHLVNASNYEQLSIFSYTEGERPLLPDSSDRLAAITGEL
ncbi:putative DNA modification/repair radical SAM protein [Anaerobacterium chartisolvens]|uniref:Putative DNA modification/repair radical SAM protein n=1 Tax=Anaerobacterium chartisolvens TaxID=1297424 RepID=A0A369B5P1_9FIRM|nr:putative DNA modification/repair radical SAM protein [Anaerobacterium chartisolvens]RCX16832.1 putative DNA modification/repair radical SAM protein [Anaerobacterium chartisolvens]